MFILFYSISSSVMSPALFYQALGGGQGRRGRQKEGRGGTEAKRAEERAGEKKTRACGQVFLVSTSGQLLCSFLDACTVYSWFTEFNDFFFLSLLSTL